MVHYSRHILDNGLTLLCNTDTNTSFVSVNLLYKVGARDEDARRTGFAHLFEHLMFGGSRNVDDFDRYVQLAGGESNAFTTNDYTNYYITVPAANIETALWLESDRMLALDVSQQALDVQKQVVIEEYKQRYLNHPYGDIWLKLRPLAYRVHPYRWPTIGADIAHIEEANLEEVQAFFHRFYAPDNAILSISGNITVEKALELVKKWFGDIPPAHRPATQLPQEPPQTAARTLTCEGNHVPASAIYLAFPMGARASDHFYGCDILSDMLSNGQSSRMYVNLIKESGLFSEADAYVTGDIDPGLFVVYGKISEGVSAEQAETALRGELQRLVEGPVTEQEIRKVINKTDARISYSEINYQSKSTNLAFFEYLGDANLINTERSRYEAFSAGELQAMAARLFAPENSSTLWYLKENELSHS